MANLIKIRRGLKGSLPAASSETLGELRYATDTNELFIDNGTENKLVNKDYIDTKVDKTNNAKKVYATDTDGNQTTISYSNTINASYIVQRDANAQIIVPEVPVADENATSKKYVDSGLALRPLTSSLATVAFSGLYTDLLNTPTFKTINSEVITGTGNIPLQKQLSGTNGNVVIYTSVTGTLTELGFDTEPTQNSNKLVKSGPIWTELQKKINYTDIKNNLTSADTDKTLTANQCKVLDEKITLAQQSTHDRGVVQNALTSQDQNYTITAVTINNGGTNYTIGDTLFLTSDLSVDAIVNVTGVNSTTGAITSVSLGQGGSFTQNLPSVEENFIGGTGTGVKFNVTTNLVNNSTLSSISNPQPNDFATVLHDEIHDDLRYVWKYVDIDGDSTYEWVSGYPITNLERNFFSDPIKNGELDTNAVTTVKIANKNVTAEKIADNAIIARHITSGTITDSHVANGADIDQSKIKNLTATLNNKVTRTAIAYQLYGTAGANTETTLTYTINDDASTIVQRDTNKQINIALTPTTNSHATSKKYVDDRDALKVDKVTGSKRVYGTDASGNQTTYDYDSFGKVDDVKVGNTSVVVNKIATLGTMAGESKDDYIKAKTTPIVAATHTKITYDSDGLVTAGSDIEESDVPSLHLSKITDVTATATELNVLDGITASTTELNYVDGVTSNIQTQLNAKVSKSGDSMINNLEMTNGSIYLEGIGSAVASSTSRLNLGTPLNVYAYLTGNNQGAFGIYSETSGTRKGIACYPNQNFFADATTKTIDLGRSNNVWKIGYINTLSDGTNSISIANIINKVTANAAITGATKCKITYDSKGLVTAGADLEESDIPDLHLSKITDITATSAEVNVLDGITASTTELNYVDGVTSNIQTQLNAKAADNAVVHTTGNETISGTKTFNDTLELKNNLSFRSYGSNDSGRLQLRAQPSDNVIRGTIAITDGYSTSGSGYNGFVAQMVARSGSTASDPFNTMRVSNKGIEYIKEANDGTITGQYIIVDSNGLVPSDRLATSGTTGQLLTKTASGQAWQTFEALPSQTGNNGKYLTTNGTTASWVAIEEYTANEVETLWNSI